MGKRISYYLLILALVMGLGLFLTQPKAKSDVQAETSYFAMEEGTTYRSRWIEGQCGLTYTARISKSKIEEFKVNNGTENNSIKLFIIPYEYVTGLGGSTVDRFASAKELINSGKYVEGFKEAEKQGAKFWYGIVENVGVVENEENSNEYLLIGGLKGIQTSNMNRRYFGIYFIEGEKNGETIREYAEKPSRVGDGAEITNTVKAGRTSNSMAYMVSYLSATKEKNSFNDWEIERLNTFLDRSIKGALGSVLQIKGSEIDTTLSNGYEFGANYADGVNVTIGTVSEVVTESNVQTLSGDITYGDDAFLYDVYLNYSKDGASKIQKITPSLDFYFKWTVQDTDYLAQEVVGSRKNVEVKKIGDNKNASVKVGFETKTTHFNTKKYTGSVDFTVENLILDRASQFYSISGDKVVPSKATATLKANYVTRFNDKNIEFKLSGATCVNENGNNVTSYGINGITGSIKAAVSVEDFNKKLNVTSLEFDRNLGQANVNATLTADTDLYSFTGSYDKYNVKLNRYKIAYSSAYTDLSGDGDNVALSADSSIKSYYYTDENVNLNQGESDGLTLNANGYSFNGFNMDTAFNSQFFSPEKLNENYSLYRGTFHKGYLDEATEFKYRNRITLSYKVKAGTKIKINGFTVNYNGANKSVCLGIVQSDSASFLHSNYIYDSYWINSSGQSTLKPYDANSDSYVLTNSSSPDAGGVYTVKGCLYAGGNEYIDESQTKRKDFDYVYLTINLSLYPTETNELTDTKLAQAVIDQKLIEIDGLYSKTVNTQATAIDQVSLVGSYYTSQGSYVLTDSDKRMRIVFTRKIKAGTAISWNTNVSSYNKTYKFGFVETDTTQFSESQSHFYDGGWKTTASGTYTITGKNLKLNNGNDVLSQQEYVYLIINIALSDETGPIGMDCNEIEAVLALFTFDGYFEQTGSATSLLNFSMPSCDVYLYGMMKANYYNVVYNYADGSSTSQGTKVVRYGKQFVADNKPTKNGYLFCGWLVSASGNQALSDNASFMSYKYNSSNVASPTAVEEKIVSSQMICNNKWTENVTFKSLSDEANSTVYLTACWTNNVMDNGGTGYQNNSKGYSLNGTYRYVFGEYNVSDVLFNDRTELSLCKFGNFTKKIKVYQEACSYDFGVGNWDDIKGNTVILGLYRYYWPDGDYTAYSSSYWNNYTVLRLDNHTFNALDKGSLDRPNKIGVAETVSTSNSAFFDGTLKASSGKPMFYEVCKNSYVTYNITGNNVASHDGYILVSIDIQSVNPAYSGTIYNITYRVNELDLFALDFVIYGNNTNYAILEDTLTFTGRNNTKSLTYTQEGAQHDSDIKSYAQYAPNISLSTSMNSSEAYSMTIEQKLTNNSSLWVDNFDKGILVTTYSKDSSDLVGGAPANYGCERLDWWAFMESPSSNPYDYLRIIDIKCEKPFGNDAQAQVLKDCTIQVIIQKVKQFLHVKVIIGDQNANGWTNDYYYVYVNRARDLSINKFASPLEEGDTGVPLGIMVVGEYTSFNVVTPLHPISVTDNMSLGTQISNPGNGWGDYNAGYFTTLSSSDRSATLNGNFNVDYYVYMNACTESADIWKTPLPIIHQGLINSPSTDVVFRFDDFFWGSWKDATSNAITQNSYTKSDSFTWSGNTYSDTTWQLMKDSIVKINLNRSGNTYKLIISGTYTFNGAGIINRDPGSTSAFEIQRVLTSDYVGAVGVALTCEWSKYRVISGIA